jgi:hypothetical protein
LVARFDVAFAAAPRPGAPLAVSGQDDFLGFLRVEPTVALAVLPWFLSHRGSGGPGRPPLVVRVQYRHRRKSRPISVGLQIPGGLT